ncbi:carbohydrate ABC transporter permease [Shinella daejeonensis]|uniref:carbohydrate ABC transporter permease n=1 Tax=Shinella daejeonensis TaxID=659017 RepID=UPI0020C75A44|nr:carbohydrate ABC transporter permease [Shinella daejeonensis]MCP8894830.1 carbohydrate ABC transporter permease [Shinella daejeonensis]
MRNLTLSKAVHRLILVATTICILFPIYWMLVLAFTKLGMSRSVEGFYPASLTFNNFTQLFTERPMLRWLLNSALVASISSALSLLIGTSAGYALSRLHFRGAGLIMILILVTQMMPPTAIVVPIYDLFRQLGMLNTIQGVTLGHISLVIPLAVWMTKGYFDSIPLDLENAARIDGCTRLAAFWHVALPLASPGLIVVFIYGFVTSWHEFLFARTLVSQQELWTGAVGLGSFRGEFFTLFEPQMAASVVFSVPVVLVFMFLQRRLISGGLAGGVR